MVETIDTLRLAYKSDVLAAPCCDAAHLIWWYRYQAHLQRALKQVCSRSCVLIALLLLLPACLPSPYAAVLHKTYTTFLGSLLNATESGGILALGKGASFPGLEAMVLDPPSPAQRPSSAAQAPSPRDAMVVRVCYPQLARKISTARLRAQLCKSLPASSSNNSSSGNIIGVAALLSADHSSAVLQLDVLITSDAATSCVAAWTKAHFCCVWCMMQLCLALASVHRC
jgi:hypothetical protein